MAPIDHLRGIWGLSGCFWILFYLFTNFRLKNFIVSRYKEETSLTQTSFFRNHVPFVLYLPDYIAGGFFGTHLMMCVWGWRIFGNRKAFQDIKDPADVISHFSKKEIRRVKWVLISGLMFFGHGVVYYVFRFIWPDMLG